MVIFSKFYCNLGQLHFEVNAPLKNFYVHVVEVKLLAQHLLVLLEHIVHWGRSTHPDILEATLFLVLGQDFNDLFLVKSLVSGSGVFGSEAEFLLCFELLSDLRSHIAELNGTSICFLGVVSIHNEVSLVEFILEGFSWEDIIGGVMLVDDLI